MLIGDRLRLLREERDLSQGDIEQKTGLLRCYVSRVENGHTIPAVETLEKFARALKIPMYVLFYDGEEPPPKPDIPRSRTHSEWGSDGKDARKLAKFRRMMVHVAPQDQDLIMQMARKMSKARKR